MCPPQSDDYDFFGDLNFRDLKLQLFSLKIFLSEVHDLLTCVPYGSMAMIPSRLWTLEISNFKIIWPH
jgi:hypothetical protein